MAHDVAPNHSMVGLPLSIVSPVDVGRLIREVTTLEEHLLQEKLRKPDEDPKLPRTSKLLDETAELNKLNLLHEVDRKELIAFLGATKKQAPLLHISFSSDPTPAFTLKLMTWLRREIHPVVLLTIGIQPNLGAGCVVRTPSHFFDMSLRQDFKDSRKLLMKALQETS